MQVWPDGRDTSVVKARRHSLRVRSGGWSAGEGGLRVMTEVVLLSWALRGRVGGGAGWPFQR